jgi:hypothetical protein
VFLDIGHPHLNPDSIEFNKKKDYFFFWFSVMRVSLQSLRVKVLLAGSEKN